MICWPTLAWALGEKLVVFHNAIFDLDTLEKYHTLPGITVSDTLITHKLLEQEGEHGLKHLARTLLGATNVVTYQQVMNNPAIFAHYACADADHTLRLYQLLGPQIQREGMTDLLQREMDLIPIIRHMEHFGIQEDQPHLIQVSAKLVQDMAAISAKAQAAAGTTFNPNSPSDIKRILFNLLGIKPSQLTETGSPSVSKDALKELRGQHPVVDTLIEYRKVDDQLRKVQKQILAKVNQGSGRIHPSFKQIGTRTGRFSCTGPNLQGIPKDPGIRAGFVAAPGYTFLDLDYSQVEPRILAQLSGDSGLISIFQNGQDIYRGIMSQILGITPDAVTEAQRKVAKGITLGIIYGTGLNSLASRSGLTVKFNHSFPGVGRLRSQVTRQANITGMVTNHYGRIRKLSGLRAHKNCLRVKARRQAFNFLIRGTAGSIMKDTMLRMAPLLGDDCRLLLHIHDELIFEVREQQAMAYLQRIKHLMKQPPPGFLEIRTPNIHPRIIDERTFQQVVQARAQRDHQTDGSRQRSWHSFSGLLVCRFCGSKLTIEGATGRTKSYKYFSCRGKKDERSDCPGIRWRAEKLESALEAKIIKVIFSEANFKRLDRELRAYQLKLATRRTDEMPHLKQSLKAVEDKIHRVVAKVAEATISDEDAKGMLTDLRRDKEHYLTQIEKITGGPLANYRITPATAQLLRAQVIDLVQNAGPRKKREFFRRFIGKIEVDATYCRVHYNLLNLTAPLASGSFQVGNLASPRTTGNEPLAKAVRLKVA